MHYVEITTEKTLHSIRFGIYQKNFKPKSLLDFGNVMNP